MKINSVIVEQINKWDYPITVNTKICYALVFLHTTLDVHHELNLQELMLTGG